MNGTQTVNNHKVIVYAVCDDGKSFSEKELREIENFLEQRGFSGNINIIRPSFLEKLGARVFG